jgi:hypothetical protein
VLLALKRSAVALALLYASAVPRGAGAMTSAELRERDASLPPPAASELGWFGLSVGAASLMKLETQLGSAEPSPTAEGRFSGGGTYALHYEKQLFHWLGARGFMRRVGWETDLSEAAGDGDRVLYDLGAAPVLSFGPRVARGGFSFFALVPVSFSWSSAPARGKREVVLESMDVGTGYRIGFGMGLLLRFSASAGMVLEAQWATQHVDHVRRYQRADGAEASLPIGYSLQWFGLSVGLAIFP